MDTKHFSVGQTDWSWCFIERALPKPVYVFNAIFQNHLQENNVFFRLPPQLQPWIALTSLLCDRIKLVTERRAYGFHSAGLTPSLDVFTDLLSVMTNLRMRTACMNLNKKWNELKANNSAWCQMKTSLSSEVRGESWFKGDRRYVILLFLSS